MATLAVCFNAVFGVAVAAVGINAYTMGDVHGVGLAAVIFILILVNLYALLECP